MSCIKLTIPGGVPGGSVPIPKNNEEVDIIKWIEDNLLIIIITIFIFILIMRG